MKFVLESVDKGIQDVIVNGLFQPTKIVDGRVIPKQFSLWTPDENKKAHYDVMAKNIISSVLTLDDFYSVFVCESTKKMCDILEVTHKAMDKQVKILIQEY